MGNSALKEIAFKINPTNRSNKKHLNKNSKEVEFIRIKNVEELSKKVLDLGTQMLFKEENIHNINIETNKDGVFLIKIYKN